MDAVHLERLRDTEVDSLRRWFPPGVSVLELGAGSGYQARRIASWGCRVAAVDVTGSDAPATARHWPVALYDGRRLPFPDGTFDIVWSSAVLEHVRDLGACLDETRRVLRPGGRAVHLLPSPVWRFWTTLAAPFDAVITAWRRRAGTASGPSAHPVQAPCASPGRPKRSFLARVQRLLLAPHGEYPNALAELYYYGRGRWRREFDARGFEIVRILDNGIFYTGYGLCPHLPLETRRAFARVFGAACHVFVLRKRG